MPGEQPRGAPPPAMTGDLQPGQAASGTRDSTLPPNKDGSPAGRTAKATREACSRAQAVDLRTKPQQVRGVEPKPAPVRAHPLSSDPGEVGSPQAPPGRSPAQARAWQASSAGGSPQQLRIVSMASARARPTLDETPEGPPVEAPQPPEGEAPSTHVRPGLPRAEAPPAPEELSFPGRVQEPPSSFTSTSHTSVSTSPRRPGPYAEFPAGGASPWPPTTEDSFQGAGFRPPPTKPESFPEGSSPGGVFEHPFPRGTSEHEYTHRPLVLAFHQPPTVWPEEAVATSATCQLPSRPAPPPPPCYPGRPRGLRAPGDAGRALPGPGAVHPAPGPFAGGRATFPDSLHQGLAEALPEARPVAHTGLGSPRGCFPGASGIDPSLGPLDTELAPPMRLPQLWDPATAPYPTPPLGPTAAPGGVFFEGQPDLGQQLGLPRSPPLPWSQVLPTAAASPHPVDMLGQPPFPPGALDWQGSVQGARAAAGKPPGPGEKLGLLGNGAGQHGGSPGPFPYNGLKDPGAQPLFFGVAQPQVSPRGAPGLPPPRVVAASPSESPLPSPATNTTGSSTCSSLSPPSCSPANPSSEDSQLPGPPAFFHAPSHPHPPPEPSQGPPVHYQPEASPFPTGRLGAQGTFKCLEDAPFPSVGPEVGQGVLGGFPQGPPPYSAHHFPLSSASLDQLDVLLTCRQCDRNYSSLAAFLEHRQFCGLLPARAKDRLQQPLGLPTPPATPKAAAGGSPSLLSPAKATAFLLAGDAREDGRDDPLRGSLGPSLAAPFALPAADLDLEDAAKLDSLITEALDGLGYQSDSPEIDSSFIDVFADEEPPGPRGPGAGQPPKARAGAVPESEAQPPVPTAANMAEPQAPHLRDGVPTPHAWPKTRSRGPAPAEAAKASVASRQRGGKRLTRLRKAQGPASGPSRPRSSDRAPHLRPRPVGSGAEPPPPQPRDLRSQAPRGRTGPRHRALPAAAGSSQRPRGPARRRRARGGSWSKELIHKILQQKNQPGPQPGPRPGPRPPRQPRGSESEEDEGPRPRGPRFRGRPRHGCRRWPRGEKRKEGDLGGLREEREQQKPRKLLRQEAPKDKGSPGPEEPARPGPGPPSSPETQHPVKSPEARAPQYADGTAAAPHRPSRATAPPEAPKESQQSTRPGAPEQPQPGRGDSEGPPPGSPPGPGSAPGMESPSRGREEPTPRPAEAGPPGHSALLLRGSSLSGDPAPSRSGAVGGPSPREGPQPDRRAPSGLFLGPEDPASRFHQDLCSKPEAPDPSGKLPCPGGVPALPPDAPYPVELAPGRAKPPLTPESTPLLPGLPVEGPHAPTSSSPRGKDTHAGTNLDPRRAPPAPPWPSVPPDHTWALLEEAALLLPSQVGQVPGRPGEPAPGQRRGTGPARPPSSPGTAGPGSLMGSLAEDELEIRRLVAELESQLQSGRGAQETPGQPHGARLQAATPLAKPSAPPQGAGTAVAAVKQALRGPPEERPSFHPGEAALLPSAACQPGPPKAELGSGEQRASPSHAGSLARYSPRRDASLPGDNGASGIRCRPASPPPLAADGPRRDPPQLGGVGSPAVPLAPALAFWGAGVVPPRATPPPGARPSDGAQEPCVSRVGGPEEGAERSQEPGPVGACPGSNASGDQRPQHPPTSPLHQLRLLVARSSEPDADPPDLRGVGTEGGGGSCSPTQDFPGAAQATAARLHLGPQAGGRPGWLGQAEEPMGPSGASQPRPETWGHPGAPGSPATVITLDTPIGHADQGQATLSAPSCAAGPPVPALSQTGPTVQAADQAASPGLKGPPALASPAPTPCSRRPLRPEDPPTAPSGGLRGLPASVSRGGPTSPQRVPASRPSGGPPARASCGQAHVDPAASLASKTGPRSPEGSPAACPALDGSPPEGPPTRPPRLTDTLSVEGCPEDSSAGAPAGSRGERPRGSPPSRAVPPPADVHAAAPPGTPTAEGLGAVRGPGAGEPDAPSSTAHRGGREGQRVAAVPSDPSTLGPAAPAHPPCPVGKAGASLQGQEGLRTRGPGSPGLTRPETRLETSSRGPPATCPSAGPRTGRDTSPRSPTGKPGPSSPQNLGSSPHQAPQGDWEQQPASGESGSWKERAPGGQPPTCEVCAASFRSRPGLSRHRARKHGLHRGAASQPGPPALPPRQPQNPSEKKSRRSPGKERRRQALSGPRRAAGPPPVQGCSAPPDAPAPSPSLGVPGAPDCPPGQGTPVQRRVDLRRTEPRTRGPSEQAAARPRPAEKGGQRRGREPTGWPGRSEGKSNKKAASKAGGRRCPEARGPPAAPDVISDRGGSNPSTVIANYPAPAGRRLPPGAERESRATQQPRGAPPGPQGTAPRGSPRTRSGPAPPPGAGACRGQRQPGTAGTGQDPPWGRSAGGRGVPECSSGRGLKEVHELPSGTPSPSEAYAEAGGVPHSCCPGDRAQEQKGTSPASPGPGLGGPLSLAHDEAAFPQLFPLALTRKKQPRVRGKSGKKPKPPAALEPSGKVGDSVARTPSHPSTDLRDSDSLCLPHGDPWGAAATGLPPSFPLDGFLGSQVPGIEPWGPCPSLWAPEPGPEAAGNARAPPGAKDRLSDGIPELHMVPAAWRGLEPPVPVEDAAPSLRDASPEPPNLERERCAGGSPGDALPLPAPGATLEGQALRPPGPCEGPAGPPSLSFPGPEAVAKAGSPGPGEAASPRQGGSRPARARRASYKCRVCFQRFLGLGERDLHRLAHSPAPPPTCYMCVERRFGSRELLREHLREKHVQSKAGPWACGMCLREEADVWMYNEHLREHAARFARRAPARRAPGGRPEGWEGGRAAACLLGHVLGPSPAGTAHAPGPGAPGDGPREQAKPQGGTSTPASSLPPTWNPPPHGGRAAPSGPVQTPPSPPPSPCPGPSEPLRPARQVHADCKDPARDCHHCGKRFPKPFKLQRHLAVHSRQRVYLCPQCPQVYPEPGQLRAHLGGEHGLGEELPLELPHTPLYACELCASVTRISRRSFACSACNYTFAKKEQFDRHMDKHRRRGRPPFPFRGVRRPGAARHRAPASPGSLPNKRRRVAMPCSPPEPSRDAPPSLLLPCPKGAAGTTEGEPRAPERPTGPVGPPGRAGSLPSGLQTLLPPPLTPFPAVLADGKGGHKPDRVPGSSGREAPAGSPSPRVQQAIPLEGCLPQPWARGQGVEGRRVAGPLSGRRGPPGAAGKGGPDHRPEAPSPLLKEKQEATSHTAPRGDTRCPSDKSSATKAGGGQRLSKQMSTPPAPSKAPTFPETPKTVAASPAPIAPAPGTEASGMPSTLKARPGPRSQGGGEPGRGTKATGGSQPQPASGQLQSETASTPAKPSHPGQNPTPDKLAPRATAQGCPEGPGEDREGAKRKRKNRAPRPARSRGGGTVPEKPPRAPRKQLAPSRVLPTKPRPGSQSSKTRSQPPAPREGEPAHAHRGARQGGLGQAFPPATPLHRSLKRSRAVLSAGLASPHARRTAEAQSTLLSQLFGQRLTSFKIPLKKGAAE